MGYHVASPDGEDLVWGNRFNPFFPGSTNLQVTRVSDDEWFFEALPTQIAFVRSTAQGPTKGKPSKDPAEVFEGNYSMPFRITVTRRPAIGRLLKEPARCGGTRDDRLSV